MEKEKLRQIKNCFRQAMNADLSASMREHGLDYRINFGVPSPRIKLIASQFEPNAADAQYLWEEDVRESKMLATYLYPAAEMTRETAEAWAHAIRYPEIADQAAMNLFVRLPFAADLALEWIESPEPMLRYTGLRLLVRLLLVQQTASPDAPASLSLADADRIMPVLLRELPSDVAYLRQVAMALAEKLADLDGWRDALAAALAPWKTSDDEARRAIYDYIVYWG